MPAPNQATIVAQATPQGVGGIAVIRISGPHAKKVAVQIAHKPLKFFQERKATFCQLYNAQGEEIDRGIITFFLSPHSYTGEDVVEISCHGGLVIPQRIVETCLAFGCQSAGPGEFTKRAFLNGKLDLTQAEAVADVISSKTTLSQQISYRILSGKFSSLIQRMKKNLLDVLTLIEAELDFSEEEVTPVSNSVKQEKIDKTLQKTSELLNTYSTGKILKEGAIVSLIGEPNVGKSSLLNAMVSEERVIVSEIPGTTRDAVEFFYQIEGIPIRFVDTAGLRESQDPIERKGIGFSHQYIHKSDLVLWIFDVQNSRANIQKSLTNKFFKAQYLPVLNKIDLLKDRLETPSFPENGSVKPIGVSALTGEGIDSLIRSIHQNLISHPILKDSEVLVTSARHKEAIEKAHRALQEAKEMLSNNLEPELVATKLREALTEMDRILGVTTADDILNNIFANFCIGK